MANTVKNPALIEIAKTLNNIPWCEEYEKMISGMLYNSYVPPLRNGRLRARLLVKKYNDHLPVDCTADSIEADRDLMLHEIMGKIGKNGYVEPPFYVDYGSNISIGTDFYANTNMVIVDGSIIKIGDRVMFGPNVSIYAATHETEIQSRRDLIEYAKEVTIGSDCWIGGNAIILPGVTIGKGCTIGAGSVVTKDIPDFSVAIGSPARVVKKVTPIADLES